MGCRGGEEKNGEAVSHGKGRPGVTDVLAGKGWSTAFGWKQSKEMVKMGIKEVGAMANGGVLLFYSPRIYLEVLKSTGGESSTRVDLIRCKNKLPLQPRFAFSIFYFNFLF